MIISLLHPECKQTFASACIFGSLTKSKQPFCALSRKNDFSTLRRSGFPALQLWPETGPAAHHIDPLRNGLKSAGLPSQGQAYRQNRGAKRLRELEMEIRALRKKFKERDRDIRSIFAERISVLFMIGIVAFFQCKFCQLLQFILQDLFIWQTQSIIRN